MSSTRASESLTLGQEEYVEEEGDDGAGQDFRCSHPGSQETSHSERGGSESSQTSVRPVLKVALARLWLDKAHNSSECIF